MMLGSLSELLPVHEAVLRSCLEVLLCIWYSTAIHPIKVCSTWLRALLREHVVEPRRKRETVDREASRASVGNILKLGKGISCDWGSTALCDNFGDRCDSIRAMRYSLF